MGGGRSQENATVELDPGEDIRNTLFDSQSSRKAAPKMRQCGMED